MTNYWLFLQNILLPHTVTSDPGLVWNVAPAFPGPHTLPCLTLQLKRGLPVKRCPTLSGRSRQRPHWTAIRKQKKGTTSYSLVCPCRLARRPSQRHLSFPAQRPTEWEFDRCFQNDSRLLTLSRSWFSPLYNGSSIVPEDRCVVHYTMLSKCLT